MPSFSCIALVRLSSTILKRINDSEYPWITFDLREKELLFNIKYAHGYGFCRCSSTD